MREKFEFFGILCALSIWILMYKGPLLWIYAFECFGDFAPSLRVFAVGFCAF